VAASRTIAALFEEEPVQWGLRGDPHLWREMRERFGSVPAPGSVEELIALVEQEFEALTGHRMSENEHFYVARYNHGEMLGGGISPEFWRERALPLLRARYNDSRDAVDRYEIGISPLHPNGIRDLFFRPSRFFTERELGWSPHYIVAAWLVGVSSTIDRIDRNMVRADLGSPRPGQEILTESWVGFWLVVLLMSMIGGALIWLIGGWWYRVRLNWSGDTDSDKREARLVYIYASLVSALPSVLAVIIATVLFENYRVYWSSNEYWSALLVLFPFWSVIVSYKGVMARFKVRRVRAQLWFLWFPIIVYIFALGLIMFLYATL
jgi:hypothetical protein